MIIKKDSVWKNLDVRRGRHVTVNEDFDSDNEFDPVTVFNGLKIYTIEAHCFHNDPTRKRGFVEVPPFPVEVTPGDVPFEPAVARMSTHADCAEQVAEEEYEEGHANELTPLNATLVGASLASDEDCDALDNAFKKLDTALGTVGETKRSLLAEVVNIDPKPDFEAERREENRGGPIYGAPPPKEELDDAAKKVIWDNGKYWRQISLNDNGTWRRMQGVGDGQKTMRIIEDIGYAPCTHEEALAWLEAEKVRLSKPTNTLPGFTSNDTVNPTLSEDT